MLQSESKPLNRWQRFLRGFIGSGTTTADLETGVPQMLPSTYFERELEREILRSDRTNSPLTVIIFEIKDKRIEKEIWERRMKQLAYAVCECSRMVDGKGWHRDKLGLRVGLILHSTEAENAGVLINKIKASFVQKLSGENGHSKIGNEIECEILSYPYHFGNDFGRFSGPDNNTEDGSDYVQESAYEDVLQQVSAISCPSFLLAKKLPFWKMLLDKSVALTVILLTSPLLIFTALLIKLTSRGPIIYKQKRVGYKQSHFNLYKFRSMTVNNNAEQSRHKSHLKQLMSSNDKEQKAMAKLDSFNPDITLVGRIIRISYIDELPQLFNVLLGHMSLVGPRPCLPHEAEEYLLWNKRRFDVVPGMTGLWQVSGKNKLTFNQMIRHDINYARKCSLLMDVIIILKTVPMIIGELKEAYERKRKAAAQEAQAQA